jgi:triphosphoribosyl-dephospho-CoA synthase
MLSTAVERDTQRLARCAVRALYAEVVLEPKPGLVSLRDNGSHTDMTAATFVNSLFALRHYFGYMARAGALAQSFEFLQALGLGAEDRMLRATGGVNTHRGAVFALGLLCATAGRLSAKGEVLTASALCNGLMRHWGKALRWRADAAAQSPAVSHGQRAARRFGLRSAGEEAALGFPTLFDFTWPTLQAAHLSGHAPRAARVQAFFATMAVLDDTNIAHRGGWEGMQFVKTSAQAFLDAGGVAQVDWVLHARAIHADFVARRLSPGGAADMLAAACWLQEMHGGATPSGVVPAANPRVSKSRGAQRASPSALSGALSGAASGESPGAAPLGLTLAAWHP